MIKIYYIGGSPCSGKSTVAEILSKKYDLHYFKVDDYLEKYTQMGADAGYEICRKQANMSAEETWMRDPVLQCKEEFAFYKEIFPFVLEDLKKAEHNKIITEGAAFLPDLMKQMNIPVEQYIAIVPTKEFQVSHYSKREWVPYVLQECSDKDKAFSNWMERDHLFASDVRQQCEKQGYPSLVNDGSVEIDDLAHTVSRHFGLER